MTPAAATVAPAETALLTVSDLRVTLPTPAGDARAVDGVDFRIGRAGRLGLVGESGCGKSLTARAIMGLAPPSARVTGTVVWEDGADLRALSTRALRRRLGRDMAMVFQDPMTYLNPVFTVGEQIAESLRGLRGMTRSEARDGAVEALRRVRINDPAGAASSYPWQLSGGMRQRALIAVALAGRPRLLIADEPTTALDVTVQAGVLDLIDERVREEGMALIMISHDLAVVARTCDTVAVMYAGKIVERGPARALTTRPAHPYTRGLIGALRAMEAGTLADPIPGQVHPPTAHPPGCRFHPRCPLAIDRCRAEEPALRPLVANAEPGDERVVACHLADS